MTSDIAEIDRPTANPRRRSRVPLLVASVMAAAWFCCLVLLAVLTANPVTVNREQLRRSDAVVVAVADDATGRDVGLHVERVLAALPGQSVPDPIRVGGVERERFEPGGRYLVPLKDAGGRWKVTPAPVAYDSEPLVYPATDEALAAAERILTTEAARPYE